MQSTTSMAPSFSVLLCFALFLLCYTTSCTSGPDCTHNPPKLNPHAGNGRVKKIAGLDCYMAGPLGRSHAIVLVSDIYGYEAPNLRKIADKLATHGFLVVVPDLLHGDPFSPDNPQRPVQEWLKDHDPSKASDEAITVIEALKHKAVTKVAAAGFCWGGKVTVNLAKTDYIQAAVLLHPAAVTVDDIKDVRVPIAVLGAEFDAVSPPQLLEQFAEILKNKPQIDGYVKIFPNVSHGFAVRYDTNDPVAVRVADEAHQDMLNWFLKYLKPKY